MTVERRQVGCRLWLQWILASTIGLTIGFVMGEVLALILTISFDWRTQWVVGAYIVAGGIGVGICIMQWFVLEKHISRAGWWVLVTATTWIMALAYNGVGNEVIGPYSFGVLTGILQWLSLRRHVSRAGLWVLTSAVGWALGFTSVEGALEGVGESAFAIGFVLAIVSLVSSAITGGTLVWLLRQSAPEA
jgi:hypothetical protein